MWKYYNNTISIYPLLLCYLFFTACASPRSPDGGPKDEDPPQIVRDKSSANMQTNFTGRSFELTFNEWVKLNDVFNQVVVTPPLEYKTDITLKKRTVRFEFDGKEELREDATYIINFGEAVKDFNEGLSAENLRFVFSTGDYIDSLSVQGRVADAFTGDPVGDVIVMLYDKLADSVVRTERPFYFGKTSESGTFKIENVRADTFKIFALVDKNFNYLFDMPSEQIAYREEPFILTDSIKMTFELELFQEEQALRLVSKQTERYGKVTLNFNKPPGDKLKINFDSVFQQQQIVYEQDSVHIWYQPKDSVDWSVYLEIQQDTILFDTLKVKAGSPIAFLAKAKLELRKGVKAKLDNHNRTKPMELLFNHPLTMLDTNAFVLLEDTLKTMVKPSLEIDTEKPGLVKLRYKWLEEKSYELLLMPGAVTDWYGLKNDSIPLAFTIPSIETFGNLIVHMTDLKKDMSYVIQLFNGKTMLEETAFQGDSIYTKKYVGIPAASYDMRVIEDENGDGRWSPGNYSLKTQSENLYFRPLGELRANWDLEVDFSMTKSSKPITPATEGETEKSSKEGPPGRKPGRGKKGKQ